MANGYSWFELCSRALFALFQWSLLHSERLRRILPAAGDGAEPTSHELLKQCLGLGLGSEAGTLCSFPLWQQTQAATAAAEVAGTSKTAALQRWLGAGGVLASNRSLTWRCWRL